MTGQAGVTSEAPGVKVENARPLEKDLYSFRNLNYIQY